MATEAHFMVKCDAPRCDRVAADESGVTLFPSLARALEVANDGDWLLEPEKADGTRRAYCPAHWHTTFGTRTPYWGAKTRRRYA